MTKRVVMVVVLLAAAAGGFWWWRTHRGDATPATSTVTQPQAGGSGTTATTPATTIAADMPASAKILVTDDKGPVADASVRLAPEEGEVVVVKTGADGVASATGLAPGRWAVSASAPGHAPAGLEREELGAGAHVELSIVLPAGGKNLTGTITDATGGAVAGARVDAALLGGLMRPGKAVATTTSGADGKYQLTVAEGQLMVEVSSADYAAQSRYVEVGPQGAIADFSLVPGGAIEGIVRDSHTKQVVGGALVEARRDGGAGFALAEGGGKVSRSGADGRFRFSGLRPGAYEIDASADARRSKAPTVVGIGVAEQVTDIEVLIGSGPVVHGVVLDEANAPVAGIEVSANGAERGVRGTDAKANAKGEFTLTGLAPGSYFAMASDDKYVPGGMATFELGDKDIARLEVHVRHAATIVGHVEPRQPCEIKHEIDPSELGMAMPRFLSPTTSGADGVFRLGPATPGKAMLFARCASGDQGSIQIAVSLGMAEVVLPVKPGASIAGKVVDGEGKPVAGVTVMATKKGPSQATTIINGMVTSGAQALTNGKGEYEVNALEAGAYAMRALDRGKPLRLRGNPPEVTLGATDKKTGVEIGVDRPNGTIKGTVTGPDGKPLADAWVSVRQDLESMIEGAMGKPVSGGPGGGDGESRMITMQTDDEGGGDSSGFAPVLTDASGQFAIANLPHAKYEVIAEAKAGAIRGRVAGITPDATVTIQALGLTTLSGTVHGPRGPAALFEVELEGPTTAARTFTDGEFQLGRVDPGAYTVRVKSSDGNAEVKVEVKPGQPTDIDVPLVANAIIVGKLVDPQGKPLANVGVVMLPDTGDGQVRLSLSGPPPSSGSDGAFRLEAKAGPSIFLAMTPPRPFTKRGLTLEAGKTLDLGTVTVDANSGPPRGP